jgi:integrase
VGDFAHGKIAVRKSKSGKARHVRLAEEGAEFFRQLCLRRDAAEPMFLRGDGEPWGRAHQARPMAAACRAARVPAMGFHQLRHTWASVAVKKWHAAPIVANNLGHSDTRMVEKHYGHLEDDYVDEVFRVGAPRFGAVEVSNLAALRG